MADELNKKRLDQITEINKQGAMYVDILKQQEKALKEMSKADQSRLGSNETFTQSAKDNLNVAQQLAALSVNDLKTKGKREKLEKKILAIKQRQNNLEGEITELLEEGTDSAVARAKLFKDQLDTSKDLVKEARKLSQTYRNIDKSVKFFDKMSDLVSDIPVINKLFPEFKKAAESARDAFAEGSDFFPAMGKGIAELGSFGLKGVIAMAIKGAISIQDKVVEMSRAFGVSTAAASRMKNNINATGLGIKESLESTIAFQKALNTSANIGAKLTQNAAVLQKRMGISAENTAALYDAASLAGMELQEFTENIAGTVALQNGLTGSAFNFLDVIESIGSVSESTRLTIGKFRGGIAQAAFETRKLGLSFSGLENSSQGLLDFESSIAAELEAELLTGKQLELQAARELALKGDLAGVANEIVKQLGSEQEYLAMNVKQREAMAKAMGMTTEEVSKSFNIRRRDADLSKLQAKDLYANANFEQKLKLIKAKGFSDEEAHLQLKKQLGEEAYQQALLQETTSEKFAQAMEQVSNQLGKVIVPFIEKLNPLLDGASKYSGWIAAAFGTIAGASIIGKLSKFIKFASGFLKLSKGAGKAVAKNAPKNVAKTAAKVGGKSVGKSLLKKIPVVGALAGLAFALSRGLDGDMTGAGLELLSGIASLVPGAGTAASVGIDGLLMARDIKNSSSGNIDAEDFTIRTHPKDTLAMAGGTQFGRETNDLLRELVQEVRASGNTYLDSRKINEVMRLNAYEQ
jgi:hypothetical protein